MVCHSLKKEEEKKTKLWKKTGHKNQGEPKILFLSLFFCKAETDDVKWAKTEPYL